MADVDIIGLDDVLKLLKEVDTTSSKHVTAAAKAGSEVALKDAKQNAPVDTGELKRGIVRKSEKRKRNKKVYRVTFSDNPAFIKYSADGSKRYFYPTAVEYGWISKNGKVVPGRAFMRNAIDHNREKIRKSTLKAMYNKLKELK